MLAYPLFILILICAPVTTYGTGSPAQEPLLRVAAAQFNSVADLDTNVASICRLVTQAAAREVQVVAFPEASLTSYNASYILSVSREEVVAAVARVQVACAAARLYCIVGTPWYNATGVRVNAALFIDREGKVLGHHAKTMLVGGDLSWAAPGQGLHTFPLTIGATTWRASLIVCHDVRFPELVRLPVLRGARIVFYISWEQDDYANGLFPPADQATYRANVQARAFENKVWLVHSNAPLDERDPAAGSHGQSRVVSPIGRVLAQAPEVGEALVIQDLNMTEATAGYAEEELWVGRYLREWWEDGAAKYVTAVDSETRIGKEQQEGSTGELPLMSTLHLPANSMHMAAREGQQPLEETSK